VARDVELDDRSLMLCLDAVTNRLLYDNDFTDIALSIFNKFKCRCF